MLARAPESTRVALTLAQPGCAENFVSARPEGLKAVSG